MRRQRNMAQMLRTNQNSRKRTKQKGDKHAIRCRVQNTGFEDAQGTLQGNNSRMDEAENQINDLEPKEAKNIQSEQEEEKYPKKGRSLRSIWDNFKQSNIHFIEVPEGEEKDQEIENLF